MSASAAESRWIKCIAVNGNIRGVAVQANDLVTEMARMHKLSGAGAVGLGEAVMGAVLLASYCKPGERINLNIQGSGAFRQALVDAYPEGTVRGYVIESSQNAPNQAIPKSGEQGPWGGGVLSVLKTKDTEGAPPYIGTVPLITGHLAKDLSFYWFQSEQIPSAVGISVEMEGDVARSAAGFLIQAMPGASKAEVEAIEKHIHHMKSLATELGRQGDPLQLLSSIFQSTAFVVLEERPLKFSCHCSLERVQRAVALVGVKEIRSMLKEDGQAIVRCDFCTKEYVVTAKDLETMLSKAEGEDGPKGART